MFVHIFHSIVFHTGNVQGTELVPVPSKGAAGGPVPQNISFCRSQLSGCFPTFSHADVNGFSLVKLVFFLE